MGSSDYLMTVPQTVPMSHPPPESPALHCPLSPDLWLASTEANPFTHPDFLEAMRTSDSATADTGWGQCPLALEGTDGVVGFAPLYQKSHSYGEYVFDFAWARAAESAGMPYFPKWLVASPFSPVPGARLLAACPDHQALLADALTETVVESGLSSAHVLFAPENELQLLEDRGWLLRRGVQFHWKNPGYRDFQDYLDRLSQPRRKKIRAERRKVAEAGVTTEVIPGALARPEDWDFFYRCYCQTYLEHGNPPYLTREFFRVFERSLQWAAVLVIATADSGERLAASLLMRGPKPGGSTLYGRYWGALQHVSCLHFELAYYAPIEWAIQEGIQTFEGGAQGEHKLWRGFEPVATGSAHWIADSRFRKAVAHFLSREGSGVDHYLGELQDRLPFKAGPGDDALKF